jgi:drug/metabolite transporter (DMT)-like permease
MTNGETVAIDRGIAQRIVSRERLTGLGWAGLSVLIFSGWFVVTRSSVTRELRIWDITALRFGIGGVLLAPAVVRREARLPVIAWGEGLLFALLWGAPFVLLVALGVQLTSAAQAASIAPALMPIFAGVFAWAVLREWQGKVRWLGYGSIIVGLSCLVSAGAVARGAPNAVGICALAPAAAMWAIYTLLFRRSELKPIQAAVLICIWSAVIYLPVCPVLHLSRFDQASPAEIVLQAGYQGVLTSGVAIATHNRAVSLLGSAAATAIIALVPAAASIHAVPVLGETPSVTGGIALAIIVLGVVLASKPVPVRPAQPVPQD